MAAEARRFSGATLVRRSLWFFWRSNLALACGCAVATAVLAGSLTVGDSVRGTLRELALERLGRTEFALEAPGLFRKALAEDLQTAAGLDIAAPVLLMEGAAADPSSGATVPRVQILGVADEFWRLTDAPPARRPHGNEALISETLARDLGLAEGDALLCSVGRRGHAPSETIFARVGREDTVRSARLAVVGIVRAGGLGAFSLRQAGAAPRNLYVSLEWLQERLGQGGKVNTLLIGAVRAKMTAEQRAALDEALARVVRPQDLGLRLTRSERAHALNVESDRLTLSDATVARVQSAAGRAGLRSAPVSIYLANSLSVVGGEQGHADTSRSIPYSTVASLPDDAAQVFGPFQTLAGGAPERLAPDDILLNAWAAEDLRARPGDIIEMTYYLHARGAEPTTASRRFTLRGVLAMEGPGADPDLVPDFEGVTDAATMRDWDPPFPIALDRIRPKDEAYWREHRAAPKAFLAPTVLRELWGSDSHWVTSVRIVPPAGEDLGAAEVRFVRALLETMKPADAGLAFRPVRDEALEAARGSSDFGLLFLSMSLFLVFAAMILVALLLRLAIERRAQQYGILRAVGFPPHQAARLLTNEGLAIASVGMLGGLPFGVGYAALIIWALRTRWSGAAGDFAFSLHVTAPGLLGGAAAGFLASAASVVWATRALRRAPALMLLAGWRAMAAEPSPRARMAALASAVASGSLAAGLLAGSLSGTLPTTGAFFGVGGLLLVASLAGVAAVLQRSPSATPKPRLSVATLAWRGASRNRLRSLLTCGLIACASFVVVTVAANRRDPARLDPHRRDSGTGGFALLARSATPILADLNTPSGRAKLGLHASPEAFDGVRFYGFALSAGDDISCLNIYRPQRPRILGVPPEMRRRGGFAFAQIARGVVSRRPDPWILLDADLPPVGGEPVVPALADQASAQWILHARLGEDLRVTGVRGGPVRLRLVGLLANSVFQSEVLIAQEAYRRHFGADDGARFFLIETPPGGEKVLAHALRAALGDIGFDVQHTTEVLANYARVQNTYLNTFQTLGALGLALGTFGVVAVLLRGVVERRSELAMLLALGLRRRRVARIILFENGLLLLLGVLSGSGAALVAVAPHLASAQADVNWASLAGSLVACVAVGLVACAAAAGASIGDDLIGALRSE